MAESWSQEACTRLREFDFSPIAERLLIEHPELRSNYADYEDELRNFFELIAASDGPIAMISPRIDLLWHAFITFTPLYRKFCEELFGYYVDHMPRTSANEIPEAAIWNFFDAYHSKFGDLPDCWFDGLPPFAVAELKDRRVPAALLWSGWVPAF